jgi:hypothetical protein
MLNKLQILCVISQKSAIWKTQFDTYNKNKFSISITGGPPAKGSREGSKWRWRGGGGKREREREIIYIYI